MKKDDIEKSYYDSLDEDDLKRIEVCNDVAKTLTDNQIQFEMFVNPTDSYGKDLWRRYRWYPLMGDTNEEQAAEFYRNHLEKISANFVSMFLDICPSKSFDFNEKLAWVFEVAVSSYIKEWHYQHDQNQLNG